MIRTNGSFRRYLFDGFAPKAEDDGVFAKLRNHRFKAIDEVATGEPSAGWIVQGTFASADFRPDNVFFGKVMLLRIRVDRKRLPTNAVKLRLAEAVAKVGGKVAKAARDKIREEITEELLRRTVPATQLLDLFVWPREKTLLVASTGAAANDVATALFRKTFGVSPRMASPGPLAEHAGRPEITLAQLGRLAPLSAREA